MKVVAVLLVFLVGSYGIMIHQDCSNHPHLDNCITLLACLRNISRCFKNDSILWFGAGVHQVPPEQTAFYIISNLSNLTLQAEILYSTNSSAVINCLSGKASFAFTNIDNLTLKGIVFENCGVGVGVVLNQSRPWALIFHRDQNISLFLANIQNLTMDRITVRNGSGIGMAGINVLGVSQMRDCCFENSNLALMETVVKECTHKNADQPLCNGGNAVFLYTDTLQNITADAKLEIENSSFYQGISYTNDNRSQVTYNPSADKILIVGGGLSLVLTQNGYSVNINLVNVSCTKNVGFRGANLYIILYSGVTLSSINVTGGTVSQGNLPTLLPRSNTVFTEGMGGGVYYEYGRQFDSKWNHSRQRPPNNETVVIVFNGTNITGNNAQTGGGMAVRFHLQPNTKVPFVHRMLLQNVTFYNNTGYFGAAIIVSETQFQQILSAGGYTVQYNKVFKTTLSNVMIRKNTSPTYGHDYGRDSGMGSAVCFNGASVLILYETVIMENECMGILLMNTQLSVANVTVYNNHGTNGGGMAFLSKSMLFLQPNNTVLNISNNRADNCGGGIFVFSLKYADISPLCFFQVYPEAEVPWVTNMTQYNATVVLRNNTAQIGREIYGGDLDNCYLMYLDWKSQKAFKKFIKVNYTNGGTEVTSDAYTVCFCEDNKPNCDKTELDMNAYPGEAIEISTVAAGQLNSVTKSNYLTTISDPDFKDLDVKILSTIDSNNANTNCFNSTFQILPKSNFTLAKFYISIDGQVQQYYWKKVKLKIKPCPSFYKHFKDNCSCMDILKDKHVKCCTEHGNITKTSSNMYVGYYDNCTYIYEHCPFDYCSTEVVTLLGESQNSQCINNRRGLLCGECQSGHSVVLGSNQCQRCSNYYLLLLVPFAVAGVVLVWVVCYFNLTVSTGVLNGLIFYANIVHINKAILYPNKHNLLTVFIDWLNLDLGIKTCFYNGLDSYTKSYLQFAFPVYIWMLSLLTIHLSRHYPIAYRILGEHSTRALATLLLLSFNKIINNVAAIFSVTTLEYECEDGRHGNVHVWSKAANILYFQGRHILVMVLGLLCLVLLVLPFIALLLLSPSLQRRTHYRCLRWMVRLKPFIDAYHGPYNVKWRCWGGILLLVRGGLLLAFILNWKNSAPVQLLFITSTAMALLPVILHGDGIYRSGIMNICEAAAIGNLALFSATAQFCLTQNDTCQVMASYFFLSVALGQLVIVVLVHGGLKHKRFLQTEVLDKLRRALGPTWHRSRSGYETIGGKDSSSTEVEIPIEKSDNGWSENYREPLLSMT